MDTTATHNRQIPTVEIQTYLLAFMLKPTISGAVVAWPFICIEVSEMQDPFYIWVGREIPAIC